MTGPKVPEPVGPYLGAWRLACILIAAGGIWNGGPPVPILITMALVYAALKSVLEDTNA